MLLQDLKFTIPTKSRQGKKAESRRLKAEGSNMVVGLTHQLPATKTFALLGGKRLCSLRSPASRWQLNRHINLLPSALCLLPSALCLLPSALCLLPFQLKRTGNTLIFMGLMSIGGIPLAATAQPVNLQVVVNSNQDTVQPDEFITLREAIEIINGTLPLSQLSDEEQQLVNNQQPTINDQRPKITFNLSPQETTIKLLSYLPAITSPGVLIDGTTQPGYAPLPEQSNEITTPAKPVVAITPAEGYEVGRGLTITADRVTISGLSLYGFTSSHTQTAATPPADIFISHPLPPPDITNQKVPNSNHPFYEIDIPPKDIVIENNWLGISPAMDYQPTTIKQPTTNNQSTFGVYVFNSNGVTIARNAIANHQGSGVITSVRANKLLIEKNLIEGNGFAGMPDAIRLEGEIMNAVVRGNWIRNNAGSAIFAFKPKGGADINSNVMSDNGQRFQRAAIYLTGNDHLVTNNQIRNQPGPGVVVAAFPDSDRNIIQDNQFSNLQGLSIDLVAQHGTNVLDYQQGDGLNPPFKTYQQQRQAGNLGINAPRFISREFFSKSDNSSVTLLGEAAAGSRVQVYRVTEEAGVAGPLNEAIATVDADENGQFAITVDQLKPGDKVSAIATHPDYGTSEPAVNAVIRPLLSQVSFDLGGKL